MAFAPALSASFAGREQAPRQITLRLHRQKMKLAAAEKTQGADRPKLTQGRMKMMQEPMSKMPDRR
jgi:hypothetical protein